MANRYAEDIRLIAGVNNLAGGIGAQTPKQPIKGGRGVAYFNADGSIGSDSGTKGETIQPEDAVGENETNTEDSNTGDDITNEPVSDQGIVPAEDLFNGNMGIGDSFTGVNGLEDCATGQEYEVRGDGQFRAPEGWEDANTPPVYIEGYKWAPGTGPSGCKYGSISSSTAMDTANAGEPYASAAAAVSAMSSSGLSAGTDASFPGQAITNENFFLYSVCDDEWDTYGYTFSHDGSASAWGFALNKYDINFSPDSWPSDNDAQLTWDSESSSFIASQYDENVDSKYKTNNAGEVHLCDSSGNQYSVVPSKDGGLVFTDVTNNLFIVRDNNGKITAAGSGSVRDQYVAK